MQNNNVFKNKSFQKPKIIPGLDFSKKEIKQARSNNQLLSMDLEITAACNGNCIYCYKYQEPGPQKQKSNELTFSEIEDFIVEAVLDHGLRRLCLLGGEPLLPSVRHKYIETLKLCNRLGIKHVTFTNGYCLNDDLIKELYDLNASICISLNGMKQKTHDFLVNRIGAYNKVIDSFHKLIECGYTKAEDNHLLSFETVVTKLNYDEIESMWIWARENNIIPYVEKLTIQGRSKYNDSLPVSNDELMILFRNLNQIDKECYNINWDITPPIAGYHCARWYISLTVNETGMVRPCVGVDFSIGNLRKSSIKDLLQSPLTRITRNIDKYIKGQCKKCDLARQCYGCRGAAYQIHGDFMAEDPNCWRINKE